MVPSLVLIRFIKGRYIIDYFSGMRMAFCKASVGSFEDFPDIDHRDYNGGIASDTGKGNSCFVCKVARVVRWEDCINVGTYSLPSVARSSAGGQSSLVLGKVTTHIIARGIAAPGFRYGLMSIVPKLSFPQYTIFQFY